MITSHNKAPQLYACCAQLCFYKSSYSGGELSTVLSPPGGYHADEVSLRKVATALLKEQLFERELWKPCFPMPPSVNLAPPPHTLPHSRAQVVTVARWHKAGPKNSNVAEEIMRMQKMMVEIVLNVTKSSRKVPKENCQQ
jgi:hypothetical protein